MNKRYIDFVPTNKDGRGKAPATSSASVRTTRVTRVSTGQRTATISRGYTEAVSGANPRATASTSTVRRVRRVAAPKRSVATQRTVTTRRAVAAAPRATSTGRATPQRTVSSGRSRQQTNIYTELPGYQNSPMMEGVGANNFALDGGASEFGVIQEVPSRFVNTAVEKRPLSRGPVAQSNSYGGYAEADLRYGEVTNVYGGNEGGYYGVAGGAPISNGYDYEAPVANNVAEDAKSKKKSRKAAKAAKKTAKKTAAASTARVATASAASSTTRKAASGARATYNVPNTPFINQGNVAKRPLSKNVYQKKKVQPTKEGNQGPVAIIAKPEKDSKAGLIVGIILTIILGAAAGTVAFLLLPK